MSIELDPITSGYNLSKINSNFQKIKDYTNDNLLHRNSPVAGEGMMNRDLDMNSNQILNLPAPNTPNSPVRVQDILDLNTDTSGISLRIDLASDADGKGAALVNGVVQIFDTVALLKDATVVVGKFYQTKGYHSAGVGGGVYQILSSAEYAATPDGFIDFYTNNGLVAKLQHDGAVEFECAGIIPADSSETARDNNDLSIDGALNNVHTRTLVATQFSYYFGIGIMVDTLARAKDIIGPQILSRLYFNKITVNNRPNSRISTMGTVVDLLPENEPTRQNTAFTHGGKTNQIRAKGRAVFSGFYLINDAYPEYGSNGYRNNKDYRRGCAYFIHSGMHKIDRIITQGFDVGSYEIGWVAPKNQVEHIAINIGFVFPSGTSTDLGGYFANGTNYDSDTNTWIVTYTSDELDRLMGFGFVFHNLYYSVANAPAVDKIQRGYGVFGTPTDVRSCYVFNAAGSEHTETQFYIKAPTTSVIINGGWQWGNNIVETVEELQVNGRRFPVAPGSDLSAGCITVDGQTFDTSSQAALLTNAQLSSIEKKGYNGLAYYRTKVDSTYVYWRIKGRLELSEFEMKRLMTANHSLTGTLKFYLVTGSNLTDFNNAFGEVRVCTLFSQSTKNAAIEKSNATLNVTGANSGDYYIVSKPAISGGGVFAVDIDLELRTAFKADYSKKSTRPTDLQFKGYDY